MMSRVYLEASYANPKLRLVISSGALAEYMNILAQKLRLEVAPYSALEAP